MSTPIGPFLAFLVLLGGASLLGLSPIRKLIQVREAKHELKHGSAGFLRTMSGWIIIAIWATGTWFVATIIGDWWATGDLDGAIARSGRRLEVLLRILAALADD